MSYPQHITAKEEYEAIKAKILNSNSQLSYIELTKLVEIIAKEIRKRI